VKKTVRKFKDPEIGSSMIEGQEIIKIKGKRQMSKDK